MKKRIKFLIKKIIFTIRFNFRKLIGGRRMKPSFMIVGAQKAGTTSLYHYLIQHPSIKSALKKEVNYFDKNYYKGDSWYKAFFPIEKNDNSITGEATPFYMFHPLSMKRLAEYNPNFKIIVLLREPASRAISHYYHEVRNKREEQSMREAFENESKRLEGEWDNIKNNPKHDCYNLQRYSYKARGLYANQIKEILAHFNEDNLMVIDSKKFFKETQNTVKDVLEFLEVNSDLKIKTQKKFNIGTYTKDPDEKIILTELKEFYKEPNEKLFKMIGKRFDWDKNHKA
ncbi:sulfotransferase [Flavobacteriaceae bacterium 144Ye]|nr:sulfotransferase [Flavobacteriaceae bacterium 144Ye]